MSFRPSTDHNWPEHIAAWRNSGHTRVAYCQQHGLAIHTFKYHIKRLQKPTQPLTLVPVKVSPMPTGSNIQLHSPKGWSLTMPIDVSPACLAQILAHVS